MKLNPGVEPAATGFVHGYTTNEIITTGTSRQQLWLDWWHDGGVNKAGRSAMINLQIARTMNQAGFAFISAGTMATKESQYHYQTSEYQAIGAYQRDRSYCVKTSLAQTNAEIRFKDSAQHSLNHQSVVTANMEA